MPIDDEYLDQIIKRWTENVKALPVGDWSKDAQRTRIERARRRRRRRRLARTVAVIVLAAAAVLAVHFLAG